MNAWISWNEPIPKFPDYATINLFVHALKAEDHGQSQKHLTTCLQTLQATLQNWHKTMKQLQHLDHWQDWRTATPFRSDLYVISTELIHIALFFDMKTAIEELLNHESQDHCNIQDLDRNTPLHIAAEQGLTELATTLLIRNAKIDRENARHMTPFNVAAQFDQMDIIKLLMDHEGAISKNRAFAGSALQSDAGSGNIGLLKTL
jgi:hypothetical protein